MSLLTIPHALRGHQAELTPAEAWFKSALAGFETCDLKRFRDAAEFPPFFFAMVMHENFAALFLEQGTAEKTDARAYELLKDEITDRDAHLEHEASPAIADCRAGRDFEEMGGCK